MLFSSPAGNDLLYDDKLVEQGRNFANKLWNAYRLVSGWEADAALPFAHEKPVALVRGPAGDGRGGAGRAV